MLALVGTCSLKPLETGQTFRPIQTDAKLLANNLQQCCDLLRPFAWAFRPRNLRILFICRRLMNIPCTRPRKPIISEYCKLVKSCHKAVPKVVWKLVWELVWELVESREMKKFYRDPYMPPYSLASNFP